MADLVGTMAAKNSLSGNLNVVYGKDGKSAYEVALANGFEGTESEWLATLKGEKGERGNSGVFVGSGEMPEDCNVQIDPNGDALTIEQLIQAVASQVNKMASVTLLASAWQGEASPYTQVVNIPCTTENSKINLNPTVEQLNIFYTKDITFVVGNNKGVITVYCIGQKPTNDYTIQALITEVTVI
jgi:hypothetical protein